jgi:hypothetical protein
MLHLLPQDLLALVAERLPCPRAMFAAWASCKRSQSALAYEQLCEIACRHCFHLPQPQPQSLHHWVHELERLRGMCAHCLQRPHARRCVADRCGSCCSDPACARHRAKPRHRRQPDPTLSASKRFHP